MWTRTKKQLITWGISFNTSSKLSSLMWGTSLPIGFISLDEVIADNYPGKNLLLNIQIALKAMECERDLLKILTVKQEYMEFSPEGWVRGTHTGQCLGQHCVVHSTWVCHNSLWNSNWQGQVHFEIHVGFIRHLHPERKGYWEEYWSRMKTSLLMSPLKALLGTTTAHPTSSPIDHEDNQQAQELIPNCPIIVITWIPGGIGTIYPIKNNGTIKDQWDVFQ